MRLAVLAAALLGISATAQITLPRSAGDRPGNYWMSLEPLPGGPPGSVYPLRAMGIYDAVPAGTYTQVAFRPRFRSGGWPAVTMPEVRINLTSTTTPAWDDRAFSAVPSTSVGPVSWPAHTPIITARESATLPELPAYVVPLAAPYTHPGGTLRVVVEFHVPDTQPLVELDVFEDDRLYTRMRLAPPENGCWAIPGDWNGVWSDAGGNDQGQVVGSCLIDEMHGPNPGETDWACTGLLTTYPTAGCTVDQDLSIMVQLGQRVEFPYPPGLHVYPITLASQILRMGPNGLVAASKPQVWSLMRHSWLEGGTPDFHGRTTDHSWFWRTARAPAITIQ